MICLYRVERKQRNVSAEGTAESSPALPAEGEPHGVSPLGASVKTADVRLSRSEKPRAFFSSLFNRGQGSITDNDNLRPFPSSDIKIQGDRG